MGAHRNEIRKKISALLPAATVAIAFTLALWCAVMVYGHGMTALDAAGTVSFRIYYILLIVSAGTWVALSFVEGIFWKGLIGAGIVLVLFQGLFLFGFRFAGTVGLGEDESFGRYDSLQAGPWAKPVNVPLRLMKVQTVLTPPEKEAHERCTVLLDGEARELGKGDEVTWKGLRVKAEAFSAAPLFILRNAGGMELEGGYFKIVLDGRENEFFQFRIVPHRFYVSPDGKSEDVWKREGATWKKERRSKGDETLSDGKGSAVSAGTPEKLRIRIMRGKLTLFSKEISKGAWIDFDGHQLAYKDGAPWVAFTVTKEQSYYLVYAGLAAMLVGAVQGLLSRRKRKA